MATHTLAMIPHRKRSSMTADCVDLSTPKSHMERELQRTRSSSTRIMCVTGCSFSVELFLSGTTITSSSLRRTCSIDKTRQPIGINAAASMR